MIYSLWVKNTVVILVFRLFYRVLSRFLNLICWSNFLMCKGNQVCCFAGALSSIILKIQYNITMLFHYTNMVRLS